MEGEEKMVQSDTAQAALGLRSPAQGTAPTERMRRFSAMLPEGYYVAFVGPTLHVDANGEAATTPPDFSSADATAVPR